jgi:drug/metabolite transporter (DMT)-like permease
MPPRSDFATLAVLIALGLCWSTIAPLGRIAGAHGVPFLVFPAVAAAGGAATLGTLALWQGRSLPLSGAHLRLYVMAGLLGHALPQLSLFLAVQHVPIGAIGLVIATSPLFTFAFALALRAEGFSAQRLLGLALGFAGALLVLAPRTALPEPGMAAWLAFAFLTPLAWALSNVLSVQWKPDGTDARSSALGMMLVSALVLWAAVLATGQSYAPGATGPGLGDAALAVNALLAGLAFVLYFMLLDRAGPVLMSFVSFLNLALATFYGVVFFGERPSPWMIAAIVLIVAGLEVVRRAPPPARR